MAGKRVPGGYSLYELIMTTAIAATVLTLGVPTFGGMLADQRLRTEVDALFHAAHLARQESVVRRRVVSLCPSADGRSCLPGRDWSAGWVLFANLDGDVPAKIDAGEPILHRHRVAPRNRVVANRQNFSFRSTERRATNGTLIFCDRARRAASRALVISYTGRPRATRNDRNGRPYECPE